VLACGPCGFGCRNPSDNFTLERHNVWMFGIMKSSSWTFATEFVVRDMTFSPGIGATRGMSNCSVVCGSDGTTVAVMNVGVSIGTVDWMGMALAMIAIERE